MSRDRCATPQDRTDSDNHMASERLISAETQMNRVLEALREVPEPSLSQERARTMAKRALARQSKPLAPRAMLRSPGAAMWAAAATVLLVSGGGWVALKFGASERGDGALATKASSTPEASVVELNLPSGDRVVASQGSKFRVLDTGAAHRRIHVSHGSVMFDVASVEEDGRFSVETEFGARVRVVGTVFGMRASRTGFSIHVYEGRVEVEHESSVRTLGAGQSATWGQRTEPLDADVVALGVRAARERLKRAKHRAKRTQHAALPPSPSPHNQETTVLSSHKPANEGRDLALGDPVARRARAALVDGRFSDALDEAKRQLAKHPTDGRWTLIKADALRGMRRFDEAAATYQDAVHHLPPHRGTVAGFAAAQLHLHQLSNPQAALTALDACAEDYGSSPLEERALALRARILERLGRPEAFRAAAKTYLNRFPRGSAAPWMRDHTGH